MAAETQDIGELFGQPGRKNWTPAEIVKKTSELEGVGGALIVLQDGLMVSPDIYRKLIKPRHKKYFRMMHDMSQAKVLFHTCGSVIDIIDDLIEIGVDILNPVQTSAKGMDPQWLKDSFGDGVTFWGGGVDTQRVLPFGTPDEVREHVKERMQILGPGGGFSWNPVHNVQYNVPPENIVTALETAYEFGRYPIV